MNKNDPVYLDNGYFPINIAYVPSKKAWKKFLFRHDLPKDEFSDYPNDFGAANVTRFTGEGMLDTLAIVLSKGWKKQRPLTIIGILNHEIQHVLQYMKLAMGEKNPGHEFEAYAVQSLSMSLIDAIEKIHNVKLISESLNNDK